MLDSALDLAEKGNGVIPCWPTHSAIRPNRGKTPIGALVPNGHKQASTDPAIIRRWWAAQPDALIGIAVHPLIMIVDVDPRNGGSVEAIEALTDCCITGTKTVYSGRNDGGRHLWFLRSEGDLNGRRLPAGVDFKTTGYTIAPPSRHPDTGQPYRWDDQPIAVAPAGLISLLTPMPRQWSPSNAQTLVPRGGFFSDLHRTGGSPSALIEFVAAQPWGNVNNGLHWAACCAAEKGWLTGIVADELVAAAVRAGENERKARRTVESAEQSMTG
jgi:hypothetical protein